MYTYKLADLTATELSRRITRIRKDTHGKKLRTEVIQSVEEHLEELKRTPEKGQRNQVLPCSNQIGSIDHFVFSFVVLTLGILTLV